MDTGKSDAGLVLAAQAGDKEAFAVVFGRHRPLLLALCRRALADPVLSEDAAQEAALVAFLNLDRLRQADRFGSWLCGIGLNISRRMIRERSRVGWSWEEGRGGRKGLDLPNLPDPDPGPEALAEAAELAERTRAAIAILPPGQRAAVVLFYLSDLTHAETADLLGIEVGAVKARLHKARRSLQRQFPDMEAEMDERLNRRTLAKTAAALTGSSALGQGATAPTGASEVDKVTDVHGETTLVSMRVVDVRRHSVDGFPHAHVVVLNEIGGARSLPIWVGEAEGTATAMQLERVEIPRPPTIAFAASLLQTAGGRLREVRIDRLVGSVFYATAVVEGNDGISSVDARPSDAINLALLTGVPIRVASAILESAAPDQAADETTVGSSEIVAEAMAKVTG